MAGDGSLIAAAGLHPVGDLTVGRQTASLAAEPGLTFDAALASLDGTASQGGLAGLLKPGSQAAATFGQLGFFEAGPASGPIDSHSSRMPVEPDGRTEGAATVDAEFARRVSVLAPTDGIEPDRNSGPVVTEQVGMDAAMPLGQRVVSGVRPPDGAQTRQRSAACGAAMAPPFKDRSFETGPIAAVSVVRVRPPVQTGATAVSVRVAPSSAAGILAVAIEDRTMDDRDTGTLGDAVRALLAKHGLILGRLTINGRAAATGPGPGGG